MNKFFDIFCLVLVIIVIILVGYAILEEQIYTDKLIIESCKESPPNSYERASTKNCTEFTLI